MFMETLQNTDVREWRACFFVKWNLDLGNIDINLKQTDMTI